MLVHPVWMTTTAWFASLELRQAPRRDYVAYSFEFWEVIDESETALTVRELTAEDGGETAAQAEAQGQWHTVVRGDTFWAIAQKYGVTVERLVELNPGVRSPNLIYVGEKVRVS